jgi:hypothetical protein
MCQSSRINVIHSFLILCLHCSVRMTWPSHIFQPSTTITDTPHPPPKCAHIDCHVAINVLWMSVNINRCSVLCIQELGNTPLLHMHISATLHLHNPATHDVHVETWRILVAMCKFSPDSIKFCMQHHTCGKKIWEYYYVLRISVHLSQHNLYINNRRYECYR